MAIRFYYNFGKQLEQVRVQRNMNQADFADLCGVSQQTISRWESCQSGPNWAAIKLVASKLGVDAKWLATGEGEPFTSQVAEDLAPYSNDPVAAELLDILAQLDESDRNRILQEAKDRLLLQEIRSRKGREKAG